MFNFLVSKPGPAVVCFLLECSLSQSIDCLVEITYDPGDLYLEQLGKVPYDDWLYWRLRLGHKILLIPYPNPPPQHSLNQWRFKSQEVTPAPSLSKAIQLGTFKDALDQNALVEKFQELQANDPNLLMNAVTDFISSEPGSPTRLLQGSHSSRLLTILILGSYIINTSTCTPLHSGQHIIISLRSGSWMFWNRSSSWKQSGRRSWKQSRSWKQ
ncbi:hypothetical protein FB446DRAFT_123083 [Lentinula raphanica]|nr:hypothetical protein FB446DRAFT_123083 [Lentinula raphanica]